MSRFLRSLVSLPTSDVATSWRVTFGMTKLRTPLSTRKPGGMRDVADMIASATDAIKIAPPKDAESTAIDYGASIAPDKLAVSPAALASAIRAECDAQDAERAAQLAAQDAQEKALALASADTAALAASLRPATIPAPANGKASAKVK